jgi:uncharacterized protein YkwD
MIGMRSDISQRSKKLRVTGGKVVQSQAVPFERVLPKLTSRVALWWLIGMMLIWTLFLYTAQTALAQGFQLYVPMVSTDASGPAGSGGTPTECGLNAEETVIAELMASDSSQGRSNPVCNAVLAQVARARARDMALRGYFGHTNPDGNGPNLLVRQAGYALPDWYGSNQDSNNVESIGGGYTSANEAWQGWLDSSAHRLHLLATDSFYAEQQAYGVGYYYNPDSPLKHYWVFLSAPLAE